MSDHQTTPDVLTVEQFAERLQVSRATVFAWMQKNILVQGRHFFKIGRVLRFVWNAEAVAVLLNCSAGPTLQTAKVAPLPTAGGRKSSAINFEY